VLRVPGVELGRRKIAAQLVDPLTDESCHTTARITHGGWPIGQLVGAVDTPALTTVIGQCLPRHRHQEFLKFLRTIDRELPKDLTIHLIVSTTTPAANTPPWGPGSTNIPGPDRLNRRIPQRAQRRIPAPTSGPQPSNPSSPKSPADA